ncbi:MAG: hypothetical protein ABR577_06130 [Pyrinomonadaceae bacterium]
MQFRIMNGFTTNEFNPIPNFDPALTGAMQTPARTASLAQLATQIKEELGEMWLPRIYTARILPLRTRAFHLQLSRRQSGVQVQHTLLGVELKIGRRRIMCPDLATARYLAAFARTGNAEVALPYDITQISRIADELELAWHRLLLLVEHLAAERTTAFRSRLRAQLIGEARNEISQAGAGSSRPQFNQNTKQRRP